MSRCSVYNFRSEKKLLNQLNDLMKKKHQLRLIELEESVLLSQVNFFLLKQGQKTKTVNS